MSFILQSLGKTVLASLALLVLLIVVLGQNFANAYLALLTSTHVICGVMWIGLLWYFNFVQIPSMPKIPAEQKPAISKVIAPTALFWFRYGALATVISGLWLMFAMGYSHTVFLLTDPASRSIGIGMWMGLIMAFNVWLIIWPNQKKALGIVATEASEQAKAGRIAMLTSRVNTMLSIPMLVCMVAQRFGGL